MWVGEINLLLVFALFLSTAALAYIISEYDIIHPLTILTSVIAFTSFMSLIAPEKWHIGISAFACGVMMVGMVSFGIGSIWTDKHLLKPDLKVENISPKKISGAVLVLMAIGCLAFAYYEAEVFYEASLMLGNENGRAGMIRTIRMASEAQIYAMPRSLVYGNYVAEAIFYCCAYVLFTRCLSKEGRLDWHDLIYALPMLANVPLLILSAARLVLFQRFIFLVILGGILYQRRHAFSTACKKRILFCSVLAGGSFLLLFLLFGFFTKKVTLDSNPFLILAHYGGLSLPALSVYLESTFLDSPYAGVTTLWEIYRKLSFFGIEIPDWREVMYVFLPFVKFNGIDTNVYTGLRRYIQDYGIVGMSLFMMMWGMVYTFFYERVRLYAKQGIYIILYASVSWPLFWFINDEGLLTYVVQTRTLYIFLLILLFDRLFIKDQCDVK